jgi:hypothetical protein
MAAQTNWVSEVPAINRKPSFEIEDATSANVTPDQNELCDGGSPLSWVTAPLYGTCLA